MYTRYLDLWVHQMRGGGPFVGGLDKILLLGGAPKFGVIFHEVA